jgi:hypothetical protein
LTEVRIDIGAVKKITIKWGQNYGPRTQPTPTPTTPSAPPTPAPSNSNQYHQCHPLLLITGLDMLLCVMTTKPTSLSSATIAALVPPEDLTTETSNPRIRAQCSDIIFENYNASCSFGLPKDV